MSLGPVSQGRVDVCARADLQTLLRAVVSGGSKYPNTNAGLTTHSQQGCGHYRRWFGMAVGLSKHCRHVKTCLYTNVSWCGTLVLERAWVSYCVDYSAVNILSINRLVLVGSFPITLFICACTSVFVFSVPGPAGCALSKLEGHNSEQTLLSTDPSLRA